MIWLQQSSLVVKSLIESSFSFSVIWNLIRDVLVSIFILVSTFLLYRHLKWLLRSRLLKFFLTHVKVRICVDLHFILLILILLAKVVLAFFNFSSNKTIMRFWPKLSPVADWLDAEVNNSSSDLDSFIETRNQWSFILNKNKGPKLWRIVLKLELIVLKFDNGMTSRYWDIIDS